MLAGGRAGGGGTPIAINTFVSLYLKPQAIPPLKTNAPGTDGEHGLAVGDDQGRRGANANEGAPPQKRARDAKYAIPTMAEASLLRETEGKLFEGNLLRLEVEELLGEVRVDYGKKSVKALEVRERVWGMDGNNGRERMRMYCTSDGGIRVLGLIVIFPSCIIHYRCRQSLSIGICEVAGACSFCFRVLVAPFLHSTSFQYYYSPVAPPLSFTCGEARSLILTPTAVYTSPCFPLSRNSRSGYTYSKTHWRTYRLPRSQENR